MSVFKEEYEVIDSHGHPGFEKKDIEKRPGCLEASWIGEEFENRVMYDARLALGDAEPFKPLTRVDEIPDFSVETWIKSMDQAGVRVHVLQSLNCLSAPPRNWRLHVSNEYVKKEFIDKYPDRFVAVGGVNPRDSLEDRIKQVEDAKSKGFKGIKIHTPTGGYPNDPEKCYPIYERCLELDLHVEIHTGTEGWPGVRLKYMDPLFIDDIANDFPKLRILQLHCGSFFNPRIALWNVMRHKNVFTDITPAHPTIMQLKYHWDIEHLRVMEYLIPDKVFFGTDFPFVFPHKPSVDHIRKIPLTAEFKKKLLRENAIRFYRLDGK